MERWYQVAVLSAGGVLGVNARYWLGIVINRWVGVQFPWATFTINVSGSFAIGLLSVLLARWLPHPQVRLLVVVGFLGGYTTFSSFSFESLALGERGELGLCIAYMARQRRGRVSRRSCSGRCLGRELTESQGAEGELLTYRPSSPGPRVSGASRLHHGSDRSPPAFYPCRSADEHYNGKRLLRSHRRDGTGDEDGGRLGLSGRNELRRPPADPRRTE